MLCAGCAFDASTPSGLAIRCATDAECRPTQRCQQGLARCVEGAAYDDTAPGLTSASLLLRPDFGNPLSQPTALGPNSTLELRLVATEPLAAVARVTGRGPDGPADWLVCVGTEESPTTSLQRCRVTAAVGTLTLSLEAALVDRATNAALVTLPEPLRIDTTTPPALAPRGGLLLRTSPWGDAETADTPSLRVLQNATALPDVRRLRFTRGPLVIGEVDVVDGGFDTAELSRSDEALPVGVTPIDGAGNAGPVTALEDERWVASFANKVAEQDFPNPHRFQVTRAASEALEGYPVTERGARDGVDSPGGRSVEVVGAASWRNVRVGQGPDGYLGFAAAGFDPRRSRLVTFGGLRGTEPGVSDQTWEWNGSDWRQQQPIDPESDGNPEGRLGAAFAFEPRRRVLVLAGGTSTSVLSDVWAWNGRSWRRLAPLPEPRAGGVMWWDARLAALVYSGGSTNQGPSLSTWALDDDGWRAVPAPGFGTVFGAPIAEDPLSGVVGLVRTDDAGRIELWRLPLLGTWERVATTGPVPSPRRFVAAAQFPPRRSVILHGGEEELPDGGTAFLDDTWEVREGTWRPLDAGTLEGLPGNGGRSGGRAAHQLHYDPVREELVQFGLPRGTRRENSPNTTWRWRGERWSLASRSSEPPLRLGTPSLLWRPDAGLFAPALADGGLVNAVLSSSGWVTTPTTFPFAFPRVVDVGVGVLLVGATPPDPMASVYRFDGANWVRGATLSWTAENIRQVQTITNGLEFLVCCGGTRAAPTLELHRLRADGGADPLVEVPGANGVATRLSDRTVVLTNGVPNRLVTVFDDGRTADAGTLPGTLLLVPHLLRSVDRARVVVPGGYSGAGLSNEAFEWAPQTGFTPLPLADPEGDGQAPVTVTTAAAEGDGTVFLIDAAEPSSGVWRLLVNEHRPAVVVRFSVAQVPGRTRIAGARLLVTAGGTDGRDAGHGVEGGARSFGAWSSRQLVTAAPASAPEAGVVSMNADEAEALRRRDGELSFILTTRGTNERGFARLVVDSVQLQLELAPR